MPDEQERETDGRAARAWHRRADVVAAIVLALAGLASAWASYQGGRWDEKEAAEFAQSNVMMTESARLFIQANQEAQVNAVLFLEWVDATADGQWTRATFLQNHMPANFQDEFERWKQAQPKGMLDGKPNSRLPRFLGPTKDTAEAARAKAVESQSDAAKAGVEGDRYDVANVILATALFLAGIATVLDQPRTQGVILLLAALLTLGSIAGMLASSIVV